MGKLAGQKDAKILSGTKAGDLPIEDAPDTRSCSTFHTHSVALFACTTILFAPIRRFGPPPAMAANVTKRLWEIGDIVDVLEAWEANNAKKIVS